MDWKEIKEKYPKAYEKCFYWLKEKVGAYRDDENWKILVGESIDLSQMSTRRLFDFFDENDLFIETSIGPKITDWYYDIFGCYNNDDIHTLAEAQEFISRPAAEKAAFERAFELLEKKLR